MKILLHSLKHMWAGTINCEAGLMNAQLLFLSSLQMLPRCLQSYFSHLLLLYWWQPLFSHLLHCLQPLLSYLQLLLPSYLQASITPDYWIHKPLQWYHRTWLLTPPPLILAAPSFQVTGLPSGISSVDVRGNPNILQPPTQAHWSSTAAIMTPAVHNNLQFANTWLPKLTLLTFTGDPLDWLSF